VLADMLEHSTNLTAEVCGLDGKRRARADALQPRRLGRADERLARGRYGLSAPGFVDHSGLGYGNAFPSDRHGAPAVPDRPARSPLLAEHIVSEAGLGARAKTGTLNFTSALAGYLPAGNRTLAFAIFAADTARRDAIPPAARTPRRRANWAGRARQLQRDMLKTVGRHARRLRGLPLLRRRHPAQNFGDPRRTSRAWRRRAGRGARGSRWTGSRPCGRADAAGARPGHEQRDMVAVLERAVEVEMEQHGRLGEGEPRLLPASRIAASRAVSPGSTPPPGSVSPGR
jgi:hypothetical protein